MEWVKAAWHEDGEQVEGTFPSVWLEDDDKTLRWPPSKRHVGEAIAKRKKPAENWLKFPIIKIKVKDSK